jgi:CCR4-NOT transcription complex subunit 4
MEKPNHELKDKINSPGPKSKAISTPGSPFINNSKANKPLQIPAQIRSLENARVIQRNLVYIINLPQSVSDESVLSSPNYFGKYGKILRIHINRGVHNPSDPTFGAYLTYGSEEEGKNSQ